MTPPANALSVFDALFANAFSESPFHRGGLPRPKRVDEVPTDLFEDATGFYAQLELPGVKKEEVELTLDRSELEISLIASTEEGEERSERVLRTLGLPETVDREGISAAMKDGILTVTVPKAAEQAPLTIKID